MVPKMEHQHQNGPDGGTPRPSPSWVCFPDWGQWGVWGAENLRLPTLIVPCHPNKMAPAGAPGPLVATPK
jgi:hypothetical protein